jgi:CHAT domain-containing protein
VEDYTLTYAPSASALRFLRSKETPVNGTALVLGDPTAPTLAGLPGAQREAVSVAHDLQTTPKLASDATESLLDHLDGKIDLLHIAAHASYDSTNPLFSRISLAKGAGKDGNLEVHEILSDIDLSGVNLVVLSACRSGVGRRSNGDEIVGLTRALLYAGTPGVVSTLWDIDDDASEALMKLFYARLLDGASVADSLRGAQIEMLRNSRYGDPKFWAAFCLTGNPQGRWKK